MPSYVSPKRNSRIPVSLTEYEFNEFIFPHLPVNKLGRPHSISYFKRFNYILTFLYTGCQWHMLPIEKNADGKPEIHYTSVFKQFQKWAFSAAILQIFENSVVRRNEYRLLDLSILHGDGTTTMAKKVGDGLGFSGHKHMKGDKIVAFCDRNCNVISPMVTAAGNRNECLLFPPAFSFLKNMLKKLAVKTKGIIISLDSIYDSKDNRKKIFNANMIPNVKENSRNCKKTKRGKKIIYNELIEILPQ
jgi:transposase